MEAQTTQNLRRVEIGINTFTLYHYKCSWTGFNNFFANDYPVPVKDFMFKYHFGKYALISSFFYDKDTYELNRYYRYAGSIGMQKDNYYKNTNLFYGFDFALFRNIQVDTVGVFFKFMNTALHFFVGYNIFLCPSISISSEIDLELSKEIKINNYPKYPAFSFAFIPKTYISVNFHLFRNQSKK